MAKIKWTKEFKKLDEKWRGVSFEKMPEGKDKKYMQNEMATKAIEAVGIALGGFCEKNKERENDSDQKWIVKSMTNEITGETTEY